MSTNQYDAPPYGYTGAVAQLLTYGEPRRRGARSLWPDYTALGLTSSDVPALISMTSDPSLNQASDDSADVWAPLHAWRALAQLGATEATEPLLKLVEELQDDDWASAELPDVFGMLGEPTLKDLQEFLADTEKDPMARVTAAEAIERVGFRHSAARDTCVKILEGQLTHHVTQPPHLNGFIIANLIHLTATEAIDVIRDAFEGGNVDLSIAGDLEEVELELGVRTERSTPRPKSWVPELLGMNLPERQGRPEQRRQRKIGRNEPCPCGSGKKHKKCCGR